MRFYHVVLSACTLHNICISGDDCLEDFQDMVPEEGSQVGGSDECVRSNVDHTEGKR